jgi:hypothetical protein
MAIVKDGINGPFRGKVGAAVGSTWRGLNVIRSRPKPPTRFSPKQLANQMRMTVTMEFLKQLVEPIRIGFRDDLIVPTAYNSAISYHKKFALAGEYPHLTINVAAVKISQGQLWIPNEMAMQFDDTHLELTWSSNAEDNARHDDQLLLVLWDGSRKIARYSLQAYRSAGQFNWEPDFAFAGAHVWAAFIRQDRSMQSESIYLGAVI